MCGIAGLIDLGAGELADPATAERMAALLRHRGPDEKGAFASGGVAFGFRRLRVIDLRTGSQPLGNEDGTVQVIANGEIYNFVELRRELETAGHRFKSRSDIEVIAHAYESWGLDFLARLRGMFALALWDGARRRLVLARDRIGQKPLFWSRSGSELAFASELKAFRAWPKLERRLDPRALHDYLTFCYIPAPRSILSRVRKLPPAHLLVVESGTVPEPVRYWRPSCAARRDRPRSETLEELRQELDEAVRLRLRSDVPVGAFLSGGVDSTLITGLAARHAPALLSFSIGFADPRFDETPWARQVAERFGTVHHGETLDASSFAPGELAELVDFMDEPFADSSFLPTYWLSRMTRRQVTVALSGDGGDELFAGYHRYRNFARLAALGKLPGPLRGALTAAARGLERLARGPSPGLAERLRQLGKALRMSGDSLGDRLLGLLTYFGEDEKTALYDAEWKNGLGDYHCRELILSQLAALPRDLSPLAAFLARDLGSSLADDALVKVDRASMACSLEVRSPFLDHRLVELALSIPVEEKLRAGTEGKAILKEAFRDLVPESVARRRKQGFEVPFAHWFRQREWRELLLDLLSPDRLGRQGIFAPATVVDLRDALLRDPEAKTLPISAYQLRHRVWILLVFQLWYDLYFASTSEG